MEATYTLERPEEKGKPSKPSVSSRKFVAEFMIFLSFTPSPFPPLPSHLFFLVYFMIRYWKLMDSE